MHPVSILQVVATFGIVLVNASSVEENFKSGSGVVQNSFEDPVASLYTRDGSIQQDSPRLLIKARKLGYCLRRLSSMAAGTPSGFKGWKRKYHSGYLAADEKLYLFFRCNEVSAKRIRRMASPMDTPTFAPTPCINDTMDDDSESSGEDTRRRRDAANNRIRRQPFPMNPRYFPPRPC